MRCGTLRADRIVVHKARREMLLLLGNSLLRTYRIALGRDPIGHKEREGDGRTPEGRYIIDWRNPKSRYFLSLHISYPNEVDRARAAALGVDPGGDIMIHGLPPAFKDYGAAHREFDWTEGCIAVTDEEIEEIWRAVPQGAPIQIKP